MDKWTKTDTGYVAEHSDFGGGRIILPDGSFASYWQPKYVGGDNEIVHWEYIDLVSGILYTLLND